MRGGVEFEVSPSKWIGRHVRAVRTELSFDDFEDVDLDGLQAAVTFGPSS